MKELVLKRAERLRAMMKKTGADAFVVLVDEKTNWESLYYMSGFRGTSGGLVIYPDFAELILDGRYTEQGKAQSPFMVTDQKGSTTDDIRESLKRRGAKIIYCESSKTFHSNWQKLSDTCGDWYDGSALIQELRRAKDAAEISFIRKAADIAADAFLDSLNHVKPGMTELEFQALLNYKIGMLGGEVSPGMMIVASGVRSAMPHGRASEKAMRAGEWVTVDFSALWNGYFCDITRNFSLGDPDPQAAAYHDLLYKAHTESVAAIRPGVTGTSVHDIAKGMLEESGIAQYFTHGLGHGLGIEIHEAPTLSHKREDALIAGDVVTVEPGVYVEGWGGLRLEDDYVVTENGAERLTDKLNQCFYRI